MTVLSELLVGENRAPGGAAGDGLADRLARGSAGLAMPVRLDVGAVGRVLACEGWWAAERGVAHAGASPGEMAEARARALARCWLAARGRGLGVAPDRLAADVVRGLADRQGTASRKPQLSGLRADTEGWFAGLDEDWPAGGSDPRVEVAGASWATAGGRALLAPDNLDAAVGYHGSGMAASSVTLLGFTAHDPSPAMVDLLGFAAVNHGVRTGWLPQRVVVWGLSTRSGLGRDVDALWLDEWGDRVIEASRRIAGVQSWFAPLLAPGAHCPGCVRFSVCPAANPPERAW